ncbi:MAG: hypothetical protein ACF8LL_05600 [Phycisphaerales bacterium]
MNTITTIAIIAAAASTASADILNAGFESGSGIDAADWAEIVGGPSGSV